MFYFSVICQVINLLSLLIFKHFLISPLNYKGLGEDQTKGHRNSGFYALLGITDHLGQTPK
jgi:hypothetical protein